MKFFYPSCLPPKVYSGRAELPEDIDAFVEACKERGIRLINLRIPPRRGSEDDWRVEFEVSAFIEELYDVLRTIEDAHVLMQTLRPVPLKENSLKRLYDLE